METSFDFGLIGLGVMGRNFLLNAADNGFSVCGLDRDPEKVDALLRETTLQHRLTATTEMSTLVKALTRPRKIMMLVPAGNAVDSVIAAITALLEPGDILIDGGNSYFMDTDKREAELARKGIHYLGVGISGGAFGARTGPSIMPGGDKRAYEQVAKLFTAVSAKYEGEACVAYLGRKSSGHYTKMVHNGIEYGLMQLIAEAYGLMKRLSGLTNEQQHELFSKWNTGRLQSYLIEITASILVKPDPIGSGALLDQILDKARQKGTGKWTSQNAMDLGIAVPTIDAAVRMREISALKELRKNAEDTYKHPGEIVNIPDLADMVEASLYFGYVLTYAQGLHLLQEASREYDFGLNLANVARIWRSGCIIRAALLQDIAEVHSAENIPEHLLLTPKFENKIRELVPRVREVVQLAARHAVPMPALFQSLGYFDALTSGELPVNLIQAQRDFFGSHTYERNDREGSFHTDW